MLNLAELFGIKDPDTIEYEKFCLKLGFKDFNYRKLQEGNRKRIKNVLDSINLHFNQEDFDYKQSIENIFICPNESVLLLKLTTLHNRAVKYLRVDTQPECIPVDLNPANIKILLDGEFILHDDTYFGAYSEKKDNMYNDSMHIYSVNEIPYDDIFDE